MLVREYYNLRADPCQLTNNLHATTAEQEARLGIPALAKDLNAARRAGS